MKMKMKMDLWNVIKRLKPNSSLKNVNIGLPSASKIAQLSTQVT